MTKVVDLAVQLWDGFSSMSELAPADDLFRQENRCRINPCILRLVNYCAQAVLGVRKVEVVETALDGQSRSCLWQNGEGVPSILIDLDQIAAAVPREDDRQRIATRLLLHEIGHLVLHFPRSRGRNVGRIGVTWSEEEEAWAFCWTLLNLALFSVVRASRETNSTILGEASHSGIQVSESWGKRS